MVLHPATPPPPSSVPSKAPPNHIELNVSPVLVTNIAHQLDPTSLVELDRHSLDLVSDFSPTAPVTNVAHQLDPTLFIELDPTSLTGLDVQLFANRPCY